MQNNPALFNAVIAGALGGSQERWLTATESSAYDSISAVTLAIATAVDEVIANEVPATSVPSANLMQSITQGILSSRFPSSDSSSEYLAIADAIAAIYTRMKGDLAGQGGSVVGDPGTMAFFDFADGALTDREDLAITDGDTFYSGPGIRDSRQGLIPPEGSISGAYYALGSWVRTGQDTNRPGGFFQVVNPTSDTEGYSLTMGRSGSDASIVFRRFDNVQNPVRMILNDAGIDIRDLANTTNIRMRGDEGLASFSGGVRLGGTGPQFPRMFSGSGDPEGVTDGNAGDLYLRFDVGELYVKTAGFNTNTNWQQVTTTP